MEGWIKLHRKFISWEWFDDNNMLKLFLFLLLSSNHDKATWRGIEIDRGQYLTGLNSLSEKTNISIQTLRTCLKRLERTGEIINKSTNKYRLITICNYDSYQDSQRSDQQATNKQPTSNQQATNSKQECKKEENVNNEKKKNKILLSQVDESTLDHREKEYFQIAVAFWQLIEANLTELNISVSGIENAEYKSWVDPIRLLMENDKRTIDEIREVFSFLKDDDFWKEQIRSTSKLRKKNKEEIKYFEVLLIKSRNEQRKQHTAESQKSGVSENYKNSILERLLHSGSPEEMQEN